MPSGFTKHSSNHAHKKSRTFFFYPCAVSNSMGRWVPALGKWSSRVGPRRVINNGDPFLFASRLLEEPTLLSQRKEKEKPTLLCSPTQKAEPLRTLRQWPAAKARGRRRPPPPPPPGAARPGSLAYRYVPTCPNPCCPLSVRIFRLAVPTASVSIPWAHDGV